MHLQRYQTEIIQIGDDILKHLECIKKISENSVLVIASKVISLCENAVALKENKKQLAKNLADAYLEQENETLLTLINNRCIPNAGIDSSNTSHAEIVIYPKDPFLSAKVICEFLKNKHSLKNFGVIIADSASQPFRYGVTGYAISWWGIKALISKIGSSDCFNKVLDVSQVNVVDALAASAVFCMGEANEKTPFVVIENIPYVEFIDFKCSMSGLVVPKEIDMYKKLFKEFNYKR